MRIANTDLLPASTTMTADVTTKALRADHEDYASIHLVWTGTPAGTFTLQVSNDATDDPTAITNWTTVTGSSQAAGGAAGDLFYDYCGGARWVRAKFTFSASTGTLTVARGNTKGAN